MTPAPSSMSHVCIQHARACLGICRHCYESTSWAQPCHAKLPDTILALEIAVALLETGNEHAHDRLCHCARVCATAAAKWGRSVHPRCRQSTEACEQFVTFCQDTGFAPAAPPIS